MPVRTRSQGNINDKSTNDASDTIANSRPKRSCVKEINYKEESYNELVRRDSNNVYNFTGINNSPRKRKRSKSNYGDLNDDYMPPPKRKKYDMNRSMFGFYLLYMHPKYEHNIL